MSSETQEAAVLETIVPQLEAEGFVVITHPSAHRLPAFMQSYFPDAIALRKDRNLAIEVVRKGSSSDKKLHRLRELLSGHPDWELRVYWVNPSSTPEPIDTTSPKDIERGIKTVEQLVSESLVAPALLMAWATLEALGRMLVPEKIAKPQTPGRLVEVLASDGYITPSDADRLRQLGVLRNKLIHGGLQEKVSSRDVKGFVSILKSLAQLLQPS